MIPHRMRHGPARTAAVVLLFLTSFYIFQQRIRNPTWIYTTPPYHISDSPNNRPGVGRIPVSNVNPLQTPELVRFWSQFVHELVAAKPNAKEVRPVVNAEQNDIDFPLEDAKKHERYDKIKMDDEDLEALKTSHTAIVQSIRRLSGSLPYQPGTRGVAMTAGGRYFGVAITSVRMLRRAGSTLPVEVFLDSWTDYDIASCERILPALNARCLVMSELWSQTPKFGNLLKYQYKVFALLFSSFEDVLFLDADAFPAHNPDLLLDIEPFISTGLITWPDFWVSTTSHYFYEIAGIETPALDTRRSSESGIMLYSKLRHAQSLLLATYYNYYGPAYYYSLLSQGASGEGDKETFLHAAMALDEPFYDVRNRVRVIGTKLNGSWETAGMMQSDPVEDWAQVQTALLSEENEAKKAQEPRPLFIHNNLVKLDVNHLFDNIDRWRNETGQLVNLWGSSEGVVNLFGYDAEKVLWTELVLAACDIDPNELCAKTKEHVATIYGFDI